MNAETVAIINQKGGVGKSTTAETLAEGLTLKGFKTLLIDLDPQGSISSGADVSKPGIYELLTGRAAAAQTVLQRENRSDIIPSSQNLVKLDLELAATGKEYRLKEKIGPIAGKYDYVVIDTPPALGILTINALTAANSLIIPSQSDLYSLQGVGQLFDTAEAVRTYTNKNLTLKGILLTRHNPRNILSRDMAQTIGNAAVQMGTFLYQSVIRECIALKEAQATRQTIFEYAPKSNAAADYMSFIGEFLESGK
jgi:chromosome partitioning protein